MNPEIDLTSKRGQAAAILAVFCAHVLAVLITGDGFDGAVAEDELRQRVRNEVRQQLRAARAGGAIAGPADGRGARGRSRSPSQRLGGGAAGEQGPVAGDSVSSSIRPADASGDGEGPALVAYKGLGSWIDLFNRGPWRNPARTVRAMHRRGVRTIYLQTATYGSKRDIVHGKAIADFIREAHQRGMYVIGWSVPAFARPRVDTRRALAAIRYRTPRGDRLDSFGLDIEATHVGNIAKRNRRLLAITRALRAAAGPDYPLSAIIPDPVTQRYWPNFPYKEVARRYDVIVPMGYWTFTRSGYTPVRRYTAASVKIIREKSRDPRMPVHVIGGIADDVGVPAARGWIRAIKEKNALGGSLYDFPITRAKTWRELKRLEDLTRQRGSNRKSRS